MAQVKVKLLRPLNGQEIGTVVSYEKADAERLAAGGNVEIIGGAKKEAAPKNKKAPAPSNKKA